MLSLICIALTGCIALERVTPGWPLPRVRGWPWRALASIAVQCLVVAGTGWAWGQVGSGASLVHLSERVNPIAAGLLGYLAASFVFYFWHRWRHAHPTLWRLFHQVHHSPRRLEAATTFYKHPAEMVVNAVVGSVLAFGVLGLSPEAAALCTTCAGLVDLFFHANLRTPRWVGFVIQRPEMHRLHHERGWHRSNYGDITWWDMLFGTYENPAEWQGECGFDGDLEQRLGDMLAGRDVHRMPTTSSRGRPLGR